MKYNENLHNLLVEETVISDVITFDTGEVMESTLASTTCKDER